MIPNIRLEKDAYSATLHFPSQAGRQTYEKMNTLETVDNLLLVENNLLHLEFELQRRTPSCFRMAREAHLLLYRGMIEALKGSANLAIIGRPSKDFSIKYRMGDGEWQEIHKVPITHCTKAWRFSNPVTYDVPDRAEKLPRKPRSGNYLIGFYDTLAMVQTECFMLRFVHSRPVLITDQEMEVLEWLHEEIRNEYEHFVPKHYMAKVSDLLEATILCLRLSRQLLFDSGNVTFYRPPKNRLEELLESVWIRISNG